LAYAVVINVWAVHSLPEGAPSIFLADERGSIFQTVDSGMETGRRIFYLKVEKVEKGKRKRGSLKNLFDFFDFAVHKILHVSKLFQNFSFGTSSSTVTIVYEH
jgi:hypothetical protein